MKLPGDSDFRRLVESIVDPAIILLDPEGRVEGWNEGAPRIKGYRIEEILGKSLEVFSPPPPELVEAGEPARALAPAAETGHHHSENWRLRKDGSRFSADMTSAAIRDGGGRLAGFAKITRDITREKWGRDRFRLAVESALNAMVMIDRDGRIVLVNAQTERMFGYGREELVGRAVEILVPERFRDRIFRVFERLHGPGEYPGAGVGLAIVKRAFERGDITHVLLDLKMPKRSGLEVLEWLRSQHALKGICAVVLTSSPEQTDRERTAALGVQAYRVKPVSFLELPGMLGEILDSWRPRVSWVLRVES